jgi:hypothetical protein
MGNINLYSNKDSNKNKFTDSYRNVHERYINYLENNYKIIKIDYLDTNLINDEMIENNLTLLPSKKNLVNNMLEYYLNHSDKKIYKKTDYLCNEEEKLCICNIHADDLRKIYDGKYYIPNIKYVSMFREIN